MSDLAESKIKTAKRLLVNHFTNVWPTRGGPDSDCRAELEDIVDLIVEAAVLVAAEKLAPSEESQAGKGYGEYWHGYKRGNDEPGY